MVLLNPVHTWIRKVKDVTFSSTLGDVDVTVDIPRDHLIHSILLEVKLGTLSGGTAPAWVSGAEDKLIKGDIKVIANGSKYIKQVNWSDLQVVALMNKQKQLPGYNKIFFTDPRIRGACPLPSWLFTSLQMKFDVEALANLTTGSPSGQSGTTVFVSVVESAYANEDLSKFKVLCERKLPRKSYGSKTGEQEFELTRSEDLQDMILVMDDNKVLSNTIFDYVTMKLRSKEGDVIPLDKVRIAQIRAVNQAVYQEPIPTGYAIVVFRPPLQTYRYSSIYLYPNIPTAGTDAGLSVIQRFLL